MKCCRCDGDLATVAYEGVAIDRCPKCRGVWLDEQEMTKIVRVHEVTFAPELVRTTLAAAKPGVADVERRTVIRCPKCQAEMKAVNYAYSSGIVVNACAGGHGIWLDGDELERAQAFAEQCDAALDQHRDDWTTMARISMQPDITNELRRRQMGPLKYLVNSAIRWLLFR